MPHDEKCAYATFIIRNDSFLPGALLFAYSLRKQKTPHDLLCIVSDNLSQKSIAALRVLFDDVLVLDEIYTPHNKRHERQDRPFLFSRFHALRLGKDGDLGKEYDKVLICDADLLPLRHYDSLFELPSPAGILNEKKSYCMEYEQGQYIIPESVYAKGTWIWHDIYRDIPHGKRIPKEITDRVLHDPKNNMGVNAALYLFRPSMELFENILKDLVNENKRDTIAGYPWPEMQYMTAKMSGEWHNMDLRYASFNGYPCIDVLYGIHYAGIKPWQMRHRSIKHFGRFEDYRLWYRVFVNMLRDFPDLKVSPKIAKLHNQIHELLKDSEYRFDRTNLKALEQLF